MTALFMAKHKQQRGEVLSRVTITPGFMKIRQLIKTHDQMNIS
jgi:hypothetical protein